jgi:hypothetical protein
MRARIAFFIPILSLGLVLKALAQAPQLEKAELVQLRAAVMAIWLPPEGAASSNLVITVRMDIGPDRRLSRPPVILTAGAGTLFNQVRDSAVRALLMSQPFNMLRPDHYEAWKQIDFTFDTRKTVQRVITEAGSDVAKEDQGFHPKIFELTPGMRWDQMPASFRGIPVTRFGNGTLRQAVCADRWPQLFGDLYGVPPELVCLVILTTGEHFKPARVIALYLNKMPLGEFDYIDSGVEILRKKYGNPTADRTDDSNPNVAERRLTWHFVDERGNFERGTLDYIFNETWRDRSHPMFNSGIEGPSVIARTSLNKVQMCANGRCTKDPLIAEIVAVDFRLWRANLETFIQLQNMRQERSRQDDIQRSQKVKPKF